MNKMMEAVSSVIVGVSETLNMSVPYEEVLRELSIWRMDCEPDIVSERYEHILCRLEKPVFVSVFNLALAQYFYPEVYNIIREGTGQGVTLRLAISLGYSGETPTLKQLKEGYNFLRKILKTEKQIENFLYSELYADERLVMYLMGDDGPPSGLAGICRLGGGSVKHGTDDSSTYEEIRLGRLAETVSGQQAVIRLTGKYEADKRAVLEGAYELTGKRLLLVDCRGLWSDGGDNIKSYMGLLERELIFYGCDICYYDGSPGAEGGGYIERLIDLQNRMYSRAVKDNTAVWVASDGDFQMASNSRIPVITYNVEETEKEKGEKSILSERLAGEPHIAVECRPELRGSGLQPIRERYAFEDMKLPQAQMRRLIQLSNHLKYKSMVYNTWNMREKYRYGKGITVLFTGPPGTGKTMAAGAISRELDIPLYRVDMSAVMDKYIGETEKRLENIFRSCENRNVILFFDEADVIFGKRSEIKDSKDKFANSSVSFMLQRIEEYDGMVILATNLKGNIDTAFLRRIKYIIPFHMPDAKTRTEIWKSGFSQEIPTGDIDTEFLGKKVELSGGYIKNIIINAAFMAAADGGRVTMKHIMQSVENEYEKLGIFMAPEFAEEYRKYL